MSPQATRCSCGSTVCWLEASAEWCCFEGGHRSPTVLPVVDPGGLSEIQIRALALLAEHETATLRGGSPRLNYDGRVFVPRATAQALARLGLVSVDARRGSVRLLVDGRATAQAARVEEARP